MSQDIQNIFMEELRSKEVAVTVFLVNGVKLQGIITGYGENTVLLRRDGFTQLIYKHSISTIMPGVAIDIEIPHN